MTILSWQYIISHDKPVYQMGLEQTLITWVHLISASIWVGGSIFLGVVLAPVLKTMYSTPQERIRIMVIVGRRFNKLAVPALLILIATGIYSSHSILGNTDILFGNNYGTYLIIKMILVASLVAVFVTHVRMINKDVEERIISGDLSGAQLYRLRRKIIIMGEITVAISVAILFFAAALDSGL